MTESKRRMSLLEVAFLYSPVLMALMLMLPRLASPNFGLLDDGATIHFSREVSRHPSMWLRFFGDSGIFVPVYELYYVFLYLLGGPSPLFFFASNTVVLIVITAAVISALRFRGGSRLQAWAAGTFFVLSGPTLECFYTNGKKDVPQVLLLTAAFCLVAGLSRAHRLGRRTLLGFSLCIVLVAASCVRETALALPAVAIGWVITGRWRLPAQDDQLTPQAVNVFLLASAAADCLFLLLRFLFVRVGLTQGSYTAGYAFSIRNFAEIGSVALGYFLRDFLYLVPLLPVVVWSFVRRRQPQARLLLDLVIWMAVWLGVYLPWHSLIEYYLLPFTIGAATFGGVALGYTDTLLVERGRPRLRHALQAVVVGLFLLSVVNSWTNGRYQILMDRTNSKLMDYLERLPPNSTVLVELPFGYEYVYELGLHLNELRGRPDISVDYFRFNTASPKQKRFTYYVVAPYVKNQLFPSVRYAFYESATTQWNQALAEFMGGQQLPVFHVEERMRVVDFGFHRIFCGIIGPLGGLYCGVPRPVIDLRCMSYGWRVYRVSGDIHYQAKPAVFFPDGTWQIQSETGQTFSLHFGLPGDIPLRGDWDGSGFSEIGLFRPSNLTWYLDTNLDGHAEVEFRYPGMRAGDIPVVGDWDGRGKSTPGYFRPIDATWHVRNSFSGDYGDSAAVIQSWLSTDMPIVGDWNGDGRDSIGFYRAATGGVYLFASMAQNRSVSSFSGEPNSEPVVADWAGRGRDSIAFVSGQLWNPRFVNCACEPGPNPTSFRFGSPGAKSLAGKWKAPKVPAQSLLPP